VLLVSSLYCVFGAGTPFLEKNEGDEKYGKVSCVKGRQQGGVCICVCVCGGAGADVGIRNTCVWCV
jgi:hypothetical protein